MAAFEGASSVETTVGGISTAKAAKRATGEFCDDRDIESDAG